ncbi:MAG: hypothetical protein AAFV88_03185 [Planctomycetota bacterium]
MTNPTKASNTNPWVERIDAVLSVDEALKNHRQDVIITQEGGRIVIRGHLPTIALKRSLAPAIRRAGVLGQICNCVEIG